MNQRIDDILFKMSDVFHVPVQFLDGDDMKVNPAFDVNAMVSKFVGLMVYGGVDVPSAFAPSYMRVHADVDFWKRHFEELKNKAEESAKPEAPQGSTEAPVAGG